MLFDKRTDRSTLPALFEAVHERFGDRLLAVGRPEPAVPGMQYAHVKVAYTGSTGANPDGVLSDGQPCSIVHTAVLNDEGKLLLGNGHYDLTPAKAWESVR